MLHDRGIPRSPTARDTDRSATLSSLSGGAQQSGHQHDEGFNVGRPERRRQSGRGSEGRSCEVGISEEEGDGNVDCRHRNQGQTSGRASCEGGEHETISLKRRGLCWWIRSSHRNSLKVAVRKHPAGWRGRGAAQRNSLPPRK